jgi:hypothetical protein
MLKLSLTVLLIGGIACGIPYFLLRTVGGFARSIAAYATGFLVSSASSMGLLLTTQAVFLAPSHDVDRVVGSGLLCAVVGPVLGVLAARRARGRLHRHGSKRRAPAAAPRNPGCQQSHQSRAGQ